MPQLMPAVFFGHGNPMNALLRGVSQGCTPEELTRAYHRKVAEWHPDKLDTMAQELRDYATRRTARINEAYHMLRRA